MPPLLVAAFLMLEEKAELVQCTNEACFADGREFQTAARTRTTCRLALSSVGGFEPSLRIVSRAKPIRERTRFNAADRVRP